MLQNPQADKVEKQPSSISDFVRMPKKKKPNNLDSALLKIAGDCEATLTRLVNDAQIPRIHSGDFTRQVSPLISAGLIQHRTFETLTNVLYHAGAIRKADKLLPSSPATKSRQVPEKAPDGRMEGSVLPLTKVQMEALIEDGQRAHDDLLKACKTVKNEVPRLLLKRALAPK